VGASAHHLGAALGQAQILISIQHSRFAGLGTSVDVLMRKYVTLIVRVYTGCLQFFDEDGSGFITRQEMLDQFRELGGLLTKEEIEQFHDILDRDGNGVIDVRPALCNPLLGLASV
jgi:hypothetical protein